MQVIDRGHFNASGGMRYGSCIHEEGPGKGHIGCKYSFLLLLSSLFKVPATALKMLKLGEARVTIDLI